MEQTGVMRLRGQVAVVTGAHSGIGRATAELFADEGAVVVAVDRDANVGVEPPRGASEGIVCDVADPGQVDELRDRVRDVHGRWDALVNSAGTAVSGRAADLSEATWRQAFEVNLHGTWLMCRAGIVVMLEHGQGSIVNIGSGAGLRPIVGLAAYSASKAAVVSLTRSIAIEYGDDGIRANCICPGVVDTPMNRDSVAERLGADVDLDTLLTPYALKRLGQPDEIAAAALFLASSESALVTGATLAVDAGRTLH